jgi:ferredoxin-NADP reductase
MADNEMPCYHMRRRYPFSNGWRCADCSYEQEYVAGEERAEDTMTVARLKNDPTHHDSQVDICGYAALIERVQEYRKRDVQNSQANSQKVNNAKP